MHNDEAAPLEESARYNSGPPVPPILLADDHPERRHRISQILAVLKKPAEIVCRLDEMRTLPQQARDARIVLLGLPSSDSACPSSQSSLVTWAQLASACHLDKLVLFADEISDITQHGRGFLNPEHIFLMPMSARDLQRILQSLSLQIWLEQENRASGICSLRFQSGLSNGFKEARRKAEEQMLKQVLWETGFNIYDSAARLGIRRETLYYFVRKHHLSRDAFYSPLE